ncbi:MAG: FG-GAP-like repeat-containing protein [Rhodocyclaceae bacterium]|nr:FG-GAP-like repeat-containing protein [Rhodocyclaceae bacterium]
MSTPGQLDISPTGAVTYTIPIQVPPGTAGIEPKLSLVYNSQSGNGLLGIGWSLSGLSAVTRCPRTVAQDGVKGGVNLDTNDRFCLDGQRLMAINGTYGAANTEYRTERESFSRIISYGAAGNGPAWFTVRTKAGQIIEYGNTTDSQVLAQGTTSARVWAVNKISDNQGNYLTFTYTVDAPSGDYYPQRIDYTSNTAANLAMNNSVHFIYEMRSDITPLYFAGSLITGTRRLTRIQTFTGAAQSREYRLVYGAGTTTNRSRITSITECSLPGNTCKPAVSPAWTEYGSNTFNNGAKWTSLTAGFLADVDGDGKADFISQQSDGLYVALSTGSGAAVSRKWGANFGVGQGYSSQSTTPVFFADVDGDGRADAVGFANDGVYVSLSSGTLLYAPSKWASDFGVASGWTTMDVYPRSLIDVNGDGRPDIVGFKDDGVYVALNAGSLFAVPKKWSVDFGIASAVPYVSNSANPRFVIDVNGDGLPDIVGFANGGVYVALNTGKDFSAASLWSADFGANAGYTTQDTYPRMLADVNGDGLPDIVSFKSDGVYVALNTGTGFKPATRWLLDFGRATSTPYASQSGFPRNVVDMNGDGKADIVGFGPNGVRVAMSTGTSFSPSSLWTAGLGSADGYTSGTPRQLADVDGDGYPDAIGTLGGGVAVATTGRSVPADLLSGISNGLGATTAVSYGPLTAPGLYTKGNTAAYPQIDVAVPLYVVSSVKTPNALGTGVNTRNYQYGSMIADLASGRGLLGFGWTSVAQADTGISTWTSFNYNWPYTGLPIKILKTISGSTGALSAVVNTYACIDPQTGGACTVAAGKTYFPYLAATAQTDTDLTGIVLPTVIKTNSYDRYGNATQIRMTTSDGFDNTIVNSYTNDTANWYLGRLTNTQVTASNGLTSTVAPVSSAKVLTTTAAPPVFTFTQTISSNTTDYNLVSAAVAGGWNRSVPLVATVTINPGVVVSATTTTAAAFSTGGGFVAQSRLVLINNGTIVGKGGAGGSGTSMSTTTWTVKAPMAGGPALSITWPIDIINNGVIAGGGGGGGAGGGYKKNVTVPGSSMLVTAYAGSSGGGGGAGGGVGGAAGIATQGTYIVSGLAGSPGTSTSGGAGGGMVVCSANSAVIANSGGAGGGLGQSGQPGSATYGTTGMNGVYVATSTPGGAGGAAVSGNSNVSWLATGTRLGAIQ